MSQYTTSTSDKSRFTAINCLLCGGVGLHLFYVGRVKAGLVHLLFGLLAWALVIDGIFELEPGMIFGGVAVLLIANVPDLARLLLKTFRDNVGDVLRE